MRKLKSLRERARLTQLQLAMRLGVAEITVRKWEALERKPRSWRVQDIAKALKCSAAALR